MSRMPLNTFNAWGNLGTGFLKGFGEAQNNKYDLLQELEKERRKQMMADEDMRQRQAQMDIGQSDIPISDRPMVVGAMSRDMNTRMPDQKIVEDILNPQSANIQNGPWSPDLPTPEKRMSALQGSIMNEKSPLAGELVAEKAKRAGKLGGPGKEDKTADLFDPTVWNGYVTAYQNARGMNKAIDAVPDDQKKIMAKNRIAQAIAHGAKLTPDHINSFLAQVGVGPMFDKAGNKLAGW